MIKTRKSFLRIMPILVVIIISITTSFAWFIDSVRSNLNINAKSIVGYFDGGDGSAEKPFGISAPIHVYNLSWLQNKGVFNDVQKFPNKTYFILKNDIDMSGSLYGSDNTRESGAVPPIGTEGNPFYGVFNGNEKVISNLWVSSHPDDWKEKPSNIGLNVGNYIGFFGQIRQQPKESDPENPFVAEIKDFVLENIEITTDKAESTVGLIAGYANGNLSNIGVKNGKIDTRGNDTLTLSSQTSLIGYVDGNVTWTGSPIGIGDKLLINPTNFTTQNGGVVRVPDSSIGSAYFVGSLTKGDLPGKQGTKNYLNSPNPISFWSMATGTEIECIQSQVSTFSTAVNMNMPQPMVDYVNSMGKGSPTIVFGAPTQTNLTNLLDNDAGLNINVPNNSIWFKPTHSGNCSIAVAKTNQSKAIRFSLYCYNRNAKNEISNWKEIVIKEPGTKGFLSNNSVLAFNINIPDDAITNNYEFVLGQSSTNGNDSAAFVYLILPGAGNSGGDEGSIKAYFNKVDYAFKYSNGSFDVLTDTNYTVKNLLLSYKNQSFNDSLYYNTASPLPTYSNTVNFFGSIITDQINSGSVGVPNNAFDSLIFPPRVTTKQTT